MRQSRQFTAGMRSNLHAQYSTFRGLKNSAQDLKTTSVKSTSSHAFGSEGSFLRSLRRPRIITSFSRFNSTTTTTLNPNVRALSGFSAATAAATTSPTLEGLTLSAENQNVSKPISMEQILQRMNAELSKNGIDRDPLSIIRWTVEQFDSRVAMSTSFGIQSAVLLHLATQVYPNIPVVWVDTGYLPKETYLYAEDLRKTLNLNLIVRTNDQWSPARMEAVHGKLWEQEDAKAHNLYGTMRKVDPLNAGLSSLKPNPEVLLSGLRASQTNARAGMSIVGHQKGRFKVLPMLRMTDEDVAKYMDMYDLPLHPLQSKGYVTVGDWHSSRPLAAGENARDTRFGGKFQECGLHAEETGEPVDTAAGPVPSSTGEVSNASTASAVPTDKLSELESFRKTGVAALESVTVNADTEVGVIMIKKVMEDGSYCRKCNDVSEKMVKDGVDKWIGYTGYADMRDSKSEGAKLAKFFGIATAPFFLVRDLKQQKANEEWTVVRSYLQLKKMLETAADGVLERKESQKAVNEGEADINKDAEVIEARKHLKELQTHLERLEKEQIAARKKLLDTKQFFSSKFSTKYDRNISLEV